MATRKWVGGAPAVAQVDKLTPANVEVGDIFTATINGKTVSFVATATTVANVTAGLTAAWNASTAGEFQEITATDSTTHITLTANEAGKPFTVTSAATNGGAADTQTLTRALVTACSGPNIADLATNWSGDTLPVDGDTADIEDSDIDILYNLDGLDDVDLVALNIRRYSGDIGLPQQKGDYDEYRPTYLTLQGAATINIEDCESGLIRIDTGSDDVTLNVNGTGSPKEDGLKTVVWKGSGTCVLNINKGSVDVAPLSGETAAAGTVRVGNAGNPVGDADVRFSDGVTLGTITTSGGTVEVNSNVTTITMNDGEVKVRAGAVSNLEVRGGHCIYNSTGTLGGNPVVSGNGHLDFDQDLRTKTVTNPIEVYGRDAKVSDRNKVVNAAGNFVLDLNQEVLSENIQIGRNIRVTRAAVA